MIKPRPPSPVDVAVKQGKTTLYGALDTCGNLLQNLLDRTYRQRQPASPNLNVNLTGKVGGRDEPQLAVDL